MPRRLHITHVTSSSSKSLTVSCTSAPACLLGCARGAVVVLRTCTELAGGGTASRTCVAQRASAILSMARLRIPLATQRALYPKIGSSGWGSNGSTWDYANALFQQASGAQTKFLTTGRHTCPPDGSPLTAYAMPNEADIERGFIYYSAATSLLWAMMQLTEWRQQFLVTLNLYSLDCCRWGRDGAVMHAWGLNLVHGCMRCACVT